MHVNGFPFPIGFDLATGIKTVDVGSYHDSCEVRLVVELLTDGVLY
jgi:hypothetical protein